MAVEGINWIPSGMELKSHYNVDMPICEGMNDIIYNNKSPKDVLYKLMIRNKKSEWLNYSMKIQ